ncbi:MAG: DPP IV N-terminal domain-containing protein [Gemmatimonadetes bacterium]|jgi:dipeptidyl-peptidase 4|nr:DPP IV N-terminal domain-containing protein [Gemmatimonadota bacterium]
MRPIAALLFLSALAVVPAASQEAPRQLTAEDYARAERTLDEHTSPLVYGAQVRPHWMEDGRFWYRNQTPQGAQFVLVDPTAETRSLAFDHQRMASGLSTVAGETLLTSALPIEEMAFRERGVWVALEDGAMYACDLRSYVCRALPGDDAAATPSRSEVVSPDGRSAVFIREHNLWVRDQESRAEAQVTFDGIDDFGYGTDNAGWTRGPGPIVKWSPDSRKIATFQHDSRGVGYMSLASTKVGHPEVDTWRYPMPEDSVIFRISRVVIDMDRPGGDQMVRFQMPPDQHRSTCSDHIACGGSFGDVEWASDSETLAFVSSSRDHKSAKVRIAEVSTGEVRDVFEEVEETFFESNGWRYLSDSNEILWFSQRANWGHLYLYDAQTGSVKRQVTSGDWNVSSILDIDEAARTLTVMGNEREAGDPYFQYFYRLNLDREDVQLLTPDSANHVASFSPDGSYLVDSYSTPVVPPTTVLRDKDGRAVMTLEQSDVSALTASGWQPPMPFSVKTRDGDTDLYGLLFRPSSFDENKKYPVVNYLYPGPQSGSVGSRSFRSSHRDLQAIAELGFVVIELDAMGTPGRSKAFHEAYYGNMGDNGLPDQMGGIRQLAERHSWIDVETVGIFGHSGGGFAAADGIMRYPDFYDVAVSQAGNHDNRNYEDDWGEKWQGLLEVNPDGTTNYDNQANHLLAENLEGKLLIAHGTLDTNVPPSNTMLVVNALIDANKDFDLLLLPNRSHGFGNEPYMMRRRWDYFVRHLLGAEPPKGYEIGQMRRPVG